MAQTMDQHISKLKLDYDRILTQNEELQVATHPCCIRALARIANAYGRTHSAVCGKPSTRPARAVCDRPSTANTGSL